jgi:putative membrane protein
LLCCKTIVMKNLFYCISLVASLTLFTACEDTPRENVQSTETDADEGGVTFIEKGIKGGLAEITAANLAKNKSHNQKVVEFANMIITDHDSIGKELKKLADDKDVVVDNVLSTEHQDMIKQLQSKKDAEFDAAYMNMMVMDHQKDVELFTNESHNQSADIQKVAEGSLPKLKKHLQMAQEIKASLK